MAEQTALLDAAPDDVGDPAPCVARPCSGLVHLDGCCRCFAGGPGPVFAARAPLRVNNPGRPAEQRPT